MRKLLIVYGTTEGQTGKIAGYLAQKARALNYVCDLHNADMLPDDMQLSRFSKVIVAASVHMERHQTAVAQFVEKYRPDLEKLPTAFLSVSLSAAGDDDERSDAWEYTRHFLSAVHWRPAQVRFNL